MKTGGICKLACHDKRLAAHILHYLFEIVTASMAAVPRSLDCFAISPFPLDVVMMVEHQVQAA